ncbi:hypothetical protein [Paraferrimonas sp. SM1919]|uniref:hypothetical protein n=1 Tax=Paraferrimonas sp. SM1919 TaxID=2662263 RepID=UPI0013D7A512|nr:hypothetical protein [Paraferrimonas sp. SM1919]
MKIKELLIELLQASCFVAILTFLCSLIGFEKMRYVSQATLFSFVFGGIPMMLAKRFILSFFVTNTDTD